VLNKTQIGFGKKIILCKWDEVTEGLRKLRGNELRKLYFSPKICRGYRN
jgi:hypothetical protein